MENVHTSVQIVDTDPAEIERACRNAYQREYKRRKRAAGDRRYFSTRETALLVAARQRAKRDGIECTITRADVVIPERCPVLGIELHHANGRHGQCENSPTLDRRDITKGYVPGNVCVISARANRLKSNATPTELLAIAEYAINGIKPAS